VAKYALSDIFQGTYPVSQYFGARPWYYLRFGLAGHEGVDWATPVGVKVLCPFARGQVLRSGWDNAYGWYVVVWDAVQRCGVWYAHLSKINVKAGQSVSRGATVGHTGRSGNVTGPHLHVNFVETDAKGNRLNRFNGYQGYLNILNNNLVSWKLSR
jgi:murein DD-endopeptidase MepM/ murein hydrolase activator NlpD